MPITTNPDGSITWTGSVTFSGATDPLSTGVATLTLTPAGGVSNLPALVNGEPGVPPRFRNVVVHQVPYGTTPPAPTWTLVSPGGAGTASVYDLDIHLNSGQQGAAGTNAAVLTAGDVVSTGIQDGWELIYSAATAKLVAGPPRRVIGPFISAFNAPYNGNAGSYVVSTIGIPAQPWAWRPRASAHLYVGGTPNVHVDAVVRLGDPVAGDIVGYGLGVTGAGPVPVNVVPHFGGAITGTSTYGQIAAGTAATLYLVAVQTASTTDNWNTVNTNGQFMIDVVPI
ncbi:hypothetical protein F5X71_34570 [Nocardia brasiliensis]|uniref:Minor tail protein n=1 Tax=Nocardia brasiliensis TaxID=37326 RepID=A0A6G9Y0M3_NOCBR|nr:hypothetical protein [Nocardia brasiliensis]QIS06752.1 hypothetical protein F5X71_34570 [Nocardia brasiliensis]